MLTEMFLSGDGAWGMVSISIKRRSTLLKSVHSGMWPLAHRLTSQPCVSLCLVAPVSLPRQQAALRSTQAQLG